MTRLPCGIQVDKNPLLYSEMTESLDSAYAEWIIWFITML